MERRPLTERERYVVDNLWQWAEWNDDNEWVQQMAALKNRQVLERARLDRD